MEETKQAGTSPAAGQGAQQPRPQPAQAPQAQPGAQGQGPQGQPAKPAQQGQQNTPPAKPAPPKPAQVNVLPAATPARPRRRHWMLLLSFVLWVIAPLCVVGWYLTAVAADQYASHVGFSVRTEEVGSAVELLGGITELSGSSSKDTDILYEYIQSQQIVRRVNERLDLASIYARPDDPVFGLGDDTRIEALADYWQRMVNVFYDRSSGLIEVRVLSFDPEDSFRIASVLFEESSTMINRLSAIARSDATRYAAEELAQAQERLTRARQDTTAFRNRTQIVDPSADIQGQMGLLNSLQTKLADAIIERELLIDSSSSNDPRVVQANRRIEVIRKQIAEERGQFGGTDGDGVRDYSELLAEYEALAANQEFAEQSYRSARAAYDAATAEAQRQSRYLASYIEPTRAETAEYPRDYMILLVAGAFLFFSWAIGAMGFYALRDRR